MDKLSDLLVYLHIRRGKSGRKWRGGNDMRCHESTNDAFLRGSWPSLASPSSLSSSGMQTHKARLFDALWGSQSGSGRCCDKGRSRDRLVTLTQLGQLGRFQTHPIDTRWDPSSVRTPPCRTKETRKQLPETFATRGIDRFCAFYMRETFAIRTGENGRLQRIRHRRRFQIGHRPRTRSRIYCFEALT